MLCLQNMLSGVWTEVNRTPTAGPSHTSQILLTTS